ncbi:MAG: Gfo/Idh/MocA family protein [Armatimonadota bacterium]
MATRREFVRDGILFVAGAVAGTAAMSAAAQDGEAPEGKRLRVALLSMAHVHARGYAGQLRRMRDRVQIVCVWDDSEQRGRSAADWLNVPYVKALSDVWDREDVDAVVINAETSKHCELMLAAASRGKHIFTEKALTVTTKDADEVVRAVKQSKIKFMISLPNRTSPETLFCKKVIDEGYLGQITFMRARIGHAAALEGWFGGDSAWFGDAKQAGGGAMFDLGCHTTDIMRWFMGAPAKVMAVANSFTGRYPVDDNCAAVIEFKNKAIGVLDASWVHRDGPNMWEIYGTEGCLVRGAPGRDLVFTSRRLKGDGTDPDPAKLPPALPSPLVQWVNAILDGQETTITVEDGRNLTELLEAIYTSARQNRAVQL